LPKRRSEYLALDVMAFAPGEKQWLFPCRVMELENNEVVEAMDLGERVRLDGSTMVVVGSRVDAEALPSAFSRGGSRKPIRADSLNSDLTYEIEALV
jgi:hypothetical protein